MTHESLMTPANNPLSRAAICSLAGGIKPNNKRVSNKLHANGKRVKVTTKITPEIMNALWRNPPPFGLFSPLQAL
jgi:hypothetical protein